MTISIKKGKTFSRVYHPASLPHVFKAITSISQTAPVVIGAPGHGLVDGQYAAVVSVKGMTQINASVSPPALSNYHKVTVIDPNTISINDINAAEFRAYTSGGYLQYFTPLDMAGCSARRTIKDEVGGTVLLELTTGNGALTIDDVNHTITETISAAVTEAITWDCGVSDMELETAAGVVFELVAMEQVEIVDEVTT